MAASILFLFYLFLTFLFTIVLKFKLTFWNGFKSHGNFERFLLMSPVP